jgi:hypothetical protein
MPNFCECTDRRRVTLTFGSKITNREQTVPCPLCHKMLLCSVGGRQILKVTIDHIKAEEWMLPDYKIISPKNP